MIKYVVNYRLLNPLKSIEISVKVSTIDEVCQVIDDVKELVKNRGELFELKIEVDKA